MSIARESRIIGKYKLANQHATEAGRRRHRAQIAAACAAETKPRHQGEGDRRG